MQQWSEQCHWCIWDSTGQ